MKKIFYSATTAIIMFTMALLPGCAGVDCKTGSGKMVTEKREVKSFSQLNIEGSFNVVIKQDSVESLSITADDNLIKDIKSNVDGNELHVKLKENTCNTGKLTLNIGVRNLSLINAAGSVTLASSGKITTKDLTMDFSGDTRATLDLNANNVKTTGSGSTEVNLTGQASSHTVSFSGSGTVNALDFVAAKYTIETSGDSHCKINVLNELNVSSSGVSNVEYKGNPTNIHEDKSGSSTLKKIE
jgi:hypothetical protein